jgi:N-acetylneuraminate synthase/N,N'-diacetyllegionaminate synthase
MCVDSGVRYCASIWNERALDWVDDFLDFYKIGSGDLTAYPLIKVFATRGKPILLSTGLANIDEVKDVVAYIRTVNPIYNSQDMLCIMQCTSMYPISASDANIRVLETFRNEFKCKVGYSDHTEGRAALIVAATLGADVLEFHFTDTRLGKSFRDHKVSLTSSELKDLREDIARTEKFLGSGYKTPQQVELSNGHLTSFRRSVYPIVEIAKGSKITPDMLTILRPVCGIEAKDFDMVVGAIALCDIAPLSPLRFHENISNKSQR